MKLCKNILGLLFLWSLSCAGIAQELAILDVGLKKLSDVVGVVGPKKKLKKTFKKKVMQKKSKKKTGDIGA